MSEQNTVSHEGIVVKNSAGNLQVMIVSKASCASCQLKGVCSASDLAEKIIDVKSDEKFNEGDKVNVVMEESQGLLAVFYTFFLPFVLMSVAMGIVFFQTGKQGVAGIASLAVLPPYYFILWLLRNKMKKYFTFRAKRV